MKREIETGRACVFVIFLFMQAGFSGTYATDVSLRPTVSFFNLFRELIYRLTREDRQPRLLLACGECFRLVHDRTRDVFIIVDS